MPALSADELAAIRLDIGQLLPDTGGVILTPTNVSDGMGNVTQTWGTAASGLSYRLDPLRGVEEIGGAALLGFQGYQLTLPHNTSLTTAQRFQDGSGNQYAVLSVDADKSWKASVRAKVEAV